MSRTRAVGIVLHENKVLLMFRKNSQEYYTFPGGGLELNESIENAVKRELFEEASIEVEVEKLLYVLPHSNGDIHYFYRCSYVTGDPQVQPGTNEYTDNLGGDNLHIPSWLSVDSLAETVLYPEEIKQQLINDLKTDFAAKPIYFPVIKSVI